MISLPARNSRGCPTEVGRLARALLQGLFSANGQIHRERSSAKCRGRRRTAPRGKILLSGCSRKHRDGIDRWRRQFLQRSAYFGGGLVLALALPGLHGG